MRKAGLWVILCLFSAAPASAQLSSQLVVSGLSLPVAVVQDPTQPNVQFVVQQGGKIRVVLDGVLLPTDFLDITPLVLSGGERGLLGLAFAPDYATSRRFFINYTRQPDGHTVISRYLRSPTDPVLAVPASRFDLRWPDGNTFIAQPFANHNGGDLQFGSDGFLYIPLGDGGASNDPAHRAQNPAELLGKMLRIDVSVSDADAEGYDVPPTNPFLLQAGVLPEIWAFGFRHPFRATVDSISRGGVGAMVIGDVGQNAWEEIDYEPFGAGGRNYGWSIREGAHDNINRAPAFTPLIDPIAEYSHSVGNVIIGGVVYRGSNLGIPFWGRYFFADFGARHIWSVGLVINPVTHEATAGQILDHTEALGGVDTVGNVSAFGIAANCDVLFLNYTAGQLRRIVDASGAPSACPTSQDPFLSSGGGVFANGTWFMRDHPTVAGAGLAGSTPGGCTSVQPVSNWLCINGGWVPPNHPLAQGVAPSGPNPPAPPPPTNGASSCTTSAPAPDWVCVNGGWVPPGHPLASTTPPTTTPPTTTPPAPPPPTNGASSCTTSAPAQGWVCVNGGWVPPGHPLASTTPPTTTPPTTPPAPPTGGTVTPNSCTTVQPASNWVCVNGGWLPPNHPLALTAPSNPTPPTATPPPSSTSCTTPDPFVGIPGLMGVCVGGGWIPIGHPLTGGGS